MEITVQNYRQLRNSFDTNKLNKEVLEVFNDVDADFEDFLDLYTDASPENDGIRDVVNNHIKLVNKYFVEQPKATPTENLKKAIEKDFGKSDKIVIIGSQKAKAPIEIKTFSKKTKSELKQELEEDFNNDVDAMADNYGKKKQEIEELIGIKKTPAAAKAKVAKVIDKTIVDNFSPEFLLIRRFWNIIKTEKVDVPFRTVQLLYMAFNKAAVERKVRKTSEAAELFTACNKKIITLFEDIPNEGKKPYEIDFTDKKLYEQIKEYVQDVAVNPAIPLLKRFIAMQNTKPEIKKAETLLKSMEKIYVNEKTNRLKKELNSAISELQDYIKKPSVEIDIEQFGLSRPANQKVCHNRVKCTGLTKDGKLRPGYKFREDTNEVIRVSKAKATTKKKNLINNKKRVVGLGFSENDDIEHIYVHDPVILVNNNFDYSTLDPTGNNNPAPTPTVEPTQQLAAPAIEVEKPLAKNKLMQMQFDSLQMDEGWENFMQDPAKNMRLAIWGKPKNGKTAGSLQMANYLTKFGNVLYNFVDQGFNKSTQDLWLSSGLANNNKAVPTDVQTLDDLEKEIKTGKYTFVFIDMISDYINKEGIKPYEFKDRFIKKYPKVSFILIFEVTKSGDFKGDQGWTHIVDAIVTVEDFCMENRGRYGMGHHIIWEEGMKKFNPKKYAEIQENEIVDVEHI